MGSDEKEQKKESVHVMVDKTLYDKMEGLRLMPHSGIKVSRSDVYNETLFFGARIQELKREVGDKKFERIWGILSKINLDKVDLGKLI